MTATRPKLKLLTGSSAKLTGSPVGLVLPEGLTLEQWQEIGVRLMRSQNAASWGLGDWLFYGEWAFGRQYEEALELTGLAYQTLANLRFLAGRFDISRRREDLSPSHHAEVAALTVVEQDRWLDRAEAEGLTVKELRAAIAATRRPRPTTKPAEDEEEAIEKMTTLTFDVPARDVVGWRQEARRRGVQLADLITTAMNEWMVTAE